MSEWVTKDSKKKKRVGGKIIEDKIIMMSESEWIYPITHGGYLMAIQLSKRWQKVKEKKYEK